MQRNRWKYILRFKEGSIPSIAKEFEAIQKTEPKEFKIEQRLEKEEITKLYKYVNEIDYCNKKINIVEYEEQILNKKMEKRQETLLFL